MFLFAVWNVATRIFTVIIVTYMCDFYYLSAGSAALEVNRLGRQIHKQIIRQTSALGKKGWSAEEGTGLSLVWSETDSKREGGQTWKTRSINEAGKKAWSLQGKLCLQWDRGNTLAAPAGSHRNSGRSFL